jgi:hypothetical protein
MQKIGVFSGRGPVGRKAIIPAPMNRQEKFRQLILCGIFLKIIPKNHIRKM